MERTSYRQYLPALNLSLERFTESVPPDGMYYVIREGQILGKFRKFAKAQELYSTVVKDSGFKPVLSPEKSSAGQAVERYLDELETYWSSSHKFRSRGGKGGRGGI